MPFKVDHIDEIVPGRFETGPNKGKKFFACVQVHKVLFFVTLKVIF